MPILKGLPGTARDIDCEFARSTAAVINGLNNCGAACMSGDNGAINVWIDDDGNYRCERYRYRVTQDSKIFGTLAKVKLWLREHRPLIA